MERKKPRNFLLTGMSDLSGWKREWEEKIFACMEQNPQHNYIFLTKKLELLHIETELDTAWFGVLVTSSKEKHRIREIRENVKAKHYHVTFEPMFDDIGEADLTGIEWIVIGTETGKRKGRIDAKPEWVWNLTKQARTYGIPVFMKEDLLPIIGAGNMIQELDAGIRIVCFVSPIFPGITDIPAIIEKVKDQCDFIWLENLNLRGNYKKTILDYIGQKHLELVSLYQDIYHKKNKTYWCELEKQIELYAEEQELPYIDNHLPDGRSVQGKPAVINYFYHEEIRGSENKGKRTK